MTAKGTLRCWRYPCGAEERVQGAGLQLPNVERIQARGPFLWMKP